MTDTALKQLNTKLKSLPEDLVEEVEKYIDFLAFKQEKKTNNIPQWQKDIVKNRMNDKKNPIDAFSMLDNLDA